MTPRHKRRKKPVKHALEYAGLRGFELILGHLPEHVALGFGALCARTCMLFRYRKKETDRRIREVFGNGIPPEDIRRIAYVSLRNMFFNVVELMRLHHVTPAWIQTHVLDVGSAMDAIRRHRERYGNVIFALPHSGNWDLAGVVCERLGLHVVAVGARQKNPLVNRWLMARRGVGVKTFERGNGFVENALPLMRQGYILAMLSDVRVKRPDVEVPFLGKTANIGRGLAVFSRISGFPLLPVYCERVGWTRHRFHVFDPIPFPEHLEKEAAIQSQTEAVMNFFDAQIRRAPEQWLWHNRRWVLTPVNKK